MNVNMTEILKNFKITEAGIRNHIRNVPKYGKNKRKFLS